MVAKAEEALFFPDQETGERRKKVLAALKEKELEKTLIGLPSFRARQVFKWISRGVQSFAEMTDLPLSLRESLENRFRLYSTRVSDCFTGADGTIKLRLVLEDNYNEETVLLSDEKGRKTACLSSQAGCAMGCVFCKTGSLGFQRNLSSGEIIEQFLRLRFRAEKIENIVLMGMGEPLLNLDALRDALGFLTEENGAEIFSKRRVTISTCGIISGIRDLADNGPAVRLAVSLTTADEKLRAELMPVTKTNPLPALKEILLYYQKKQGKRITLEAVLLGGVNTRREDADALAEFADGLDTAVNLIPWNPIEGMRFNGKALGEPPRAEVAVFADALQKNGLNVTKRLKKGRGVSGACGQLGGIL